MNILSIFGHQTSAAHTVSQPSPSPSRPTPAPSAPLASAPADTGVAAQTTQALAGSTARASNPAAAAQVAKTQGNAASAMLGATVPPTVFPEKSEHPEGSIRYDYNKDEVGEIVRNSATAAQLLAGSPHYTAMGVDPHQSSKRYLDPTTLQPSEEAGTTVPDGKPVMKCMQNSPTGACTSAIPDQIRHSVLQCNYKNEDDGKLYTVTEKSMQDYSMPQMQRNVCGGHRLSYDPASMSYEPQQTDTRGNQLYLNPSNIISAVPLDQN